jgi:hypothetical protein
MCQNPFVRLTIGPHEHATQVCGGGTLDQSTMVTSLPASLALAGGWWWARALAEYLKKAYPDTIRIDVVRVIARGRPELI